MSISFEIPTPISTRSCSTTNAVASVISAVQLKSPPTFRFSYLRVPLGSRTRDPDSLRLGIFDKINRKRCQAEHIVRTVVISDDHVFPVNVQRTCKTDFSVGYSGLDSNFYIIRFIPINQLFGFQEIIMTFGYRIFRCKRIIPQVVLPLRVYNSRPETIRPWRRASGQPVAARSR